MRVLYDLYYAQTLNGSKFHGGGEYMKTVFKSIVMNDNENCSIEVFYNPKEYLDDWIHLLIKGNSIKEHFVYSREDISNLLECGYDVFYTGMPYQYLDIDFPKSLRKICTVHGLRQAEKPADITALFYCKKKEKLKFFVKCIFPKFFTNRALKSYQKCISKFDIIVTDSNHSNSSINTLLNTNGASIKTLYAPAKNDDNSSLCDEEIREIDAIGKYILLIGGNRWEKNAVRAIMAFENLLDKELADIKMVICGTLPKSVKKKINHIDNYVFFDFVSTAFLDYLYKKCDFFIYPTLNEGFGMPPLEAMRYGKTCVVSAVCSLTEICGDAVYYVNPYDLMEIENRIYYAIYNKIDALNVISRYNAVYDRQRQDLNLIVKTIVS